MVRKLIHMLPNLQKQLPNSLYPYTTPASPIICGYCCFAPIVVLALYCGVVLITTEMRLKISMLRFVLFYLVFPWFSKIVLIFLSFAFRADQWLQQAQRRRIRHWVQPLSSPAQRNVRHGLSVVSSSLVIVMIDNTLTIQCAVLQQLTTQAKPRETSSFQSSLSGDSQRRLRLHWYVFYLHFFQVSAVHYCMAFFFPLSCSQICPKHRTFCVTNITL